MTADRADSKATEEARLDQLGAQVETCRRYLSGDITERQACDWFGTDRLTFRTQIAELCTRRRRAGGWWRLLFAAEDATPDRADPERTRLAWLFHELGVCEHDDTGSAYDCMDIAERVEQHLATPDRADLRAALNALITDGDVDADLFMHDPTYHAVVTVWRGATPDRADPQ